MIFIFYIGCVGDNPSKTCFKIPNGCDETGSCKVVVSYELSGTDMLFKMVGRSNGYIAVGLSPDNDKMGDDLTTGKEKKVIFSPILSFHIVTSFVACYFDNGNGQVGIQSGYNVGYSNYPIHPPMKGIYDFRGNYEDGFIYCEFKRPSVLTVEPIQHNNRFLNSNKTFRLLSDKYVVFLAEGSFRDGRISKHTLKDSSSDPLVIAYFKIA